MARPQCCRRVRGKPACALFKPSGVRLGAREEVVLGLDELEALRLSEIEGLEQGPAAGVMGVSRPTFGRILASARRIAADAIVNGRVLRIEGGTVLEDGACRFTCAACGHEWLGRGEPGHCPECKAQDARPCGCGADESGEKGCCRSRGTKQSRKGRFHEPLHSRTR